MKRYTLDYLFGGLWYTVYRRFWTRRGAERMGERLCADRINVRVVPRRQRAILRRQP